MLLGLTQYGELCTVASLVLLGVETDQGIMFWYVRVESTLA